jgi:hypothetical protein
VCSVGHLLYGKYGENTTRLHVTFIFKPKEDFYSIYVIRFSTTRVAFFCLLCRNGCAMELLAWFESVVLSAFSYDAQADEAPDAPMRINMESWNTLPPLFALCANSSLDHNAVKTLASRQRDGSKIAPGRMFFCSFFQRSKFSISSGLKCGMF